MPTYEYRCPDGHEFEHFFRSIREGVAELQCPACGKMAQRQMSGGSGLVFKGSGFYITDYGKDGKKDQRSGDRRPSSSEAGGESSEAKTPGSKGEGSTSGGESAKPKDTPKKSDE